MLRPAVGNHEYGTSAAAGYFATFPGGRAGRPGEGWYSYALGSWHVVVLNANCGTVGCATGSPQQRWLAADLARHPARCTLAYWHQPRFSSGLHGSDKALAPLWRTLQAAGADIVLSGHDHDYERFAPQDANGRADPRHGIVQFVVGSGGRSLYPILLGRPNSRVRASTFGVLRLTLGPAGVEQLDPGAIAFFPRGPEGAHQVRNDGDEPVRVAMFSTVVLPTATAYPDSGKVGVYTGDPGEDLIAERSAGVDYYRGEA